MIFWVWFVSDDGWCMIGQVSVDIMMVIGLSDLEVVQLYWGVWLLKVLILIVWDIYWNELQGFVVWMGRIDEVNWLVDSWVQIKCWLFGIELCILISFVWGCECFYMVFDYNCWVDCE